MYKLLRGVFFLFNPESIHYFSMNALRFFCNSALLRNQIASAFRTAVDLHFNFLGLKFRNRIGLGAGFDKNALYLRELETLGFGFVEIGTVTPLPQAGNPKPRLFRLPADKALVNRMGFNNDGAKEIAARLQSWRQSAKETKLIIGGNIGKNKNTANENAWEDYEKCFQALHQWVDYFVVNVSSPNTPGLRELQEKASLAKIFGVLQTKNRQLPKPRPLLLKIAPDLSNEQVDDVISLAMEIGLDGLIISNTTISREALKTAPAIIEKIGAGGLSGLPVKDRSTSLISYVKAKSGGRINIIGSGGIFTAADAEEKFRAGASLVQVWTGFIYEGPSIIKNICKG